MLLAPKIAPILDWEVGEQNAGYFLEYCSRDSGWAFYSSESWLRENFFKLSN